MHINRKEEDLLKIRQLLDDGELSEEEYYKLKISILNKKERNIQRLAIRA